MVALAVSPVATQAQTADIALVNGRIYTVDDRRSWAQAVGIRDGRFIVVGSNAEVESYIGDDTRTIDLDGRMVMPGIQDLHIHPVAATLVEMFECKFPASLTAEEVAKKVGECAASQPPGTWIRGGSYGAHLLEADRKPHKSLLDAVVPEHPVYLRSSGGHSGWANSLALQLAGIGEETPDPESGEIGRDLFTGETTGMLFESGNRLVARVLPDYTPDQYRGAVKRLAAMLNREGITAIKDAATSATVAAAYTASDKAGELTLRVATSLSWGGEAPDGDELPKAIREREQFRSNYVYPDFVKIFVDGSAGARKAVYLEPYQTDEKHGDAYYGEFITPPEELKRRLILLDREGLSVKMHCGGDAAVRAALDAIEAAREANGDSGLLHEIAHPNIVAPEDIPRFSSLGAVADLSPLYWYPSRIVDVLTKTLGTERVERIWSIKTMVDAGVHAVWGSDWPAVVPNANPWRGLEAIVTRRDPEGERPGQFHPEQAIDLVSAIEIFTRNGAHAMRLEQVTGSIEAGKFADMIVLDRNLFEIPADEIGDVQVLLTLLEGNVVYESDAITGPR
jgi:predicted amidohydrolase YtcJ